MVVFVAIIIIIILYTVFLKTNHVRKLAANLPGEMDLPLIGNIHQLGLTLQELLERLLYMLKKYNYDLFRVFIGPKLFVVVSHPDDMQEILTNTNKFKKADNVYKFLTPWLRQGLLTSAGEKWKNHRRIITPTFHFKILANFSEIIEKEGNRLIAKLSSVADGRVTDICDFISMCALDVISETAMGVSINAQGDAESEVVKSVDDLCRIAMNRILNPLKQPDFLFNLTSDGIAQNRALKVIKGFNEKVINERRLLLRKEVINSENNNEDNETGQKKRSALLDMLITANIDGEPLTNDEISDEVSTFIFAGHDTVTSTASFALFNLANNPEIQNKVLAEQIELLGRDTQNAASYSDLQNMKYLELVIKESLRMCSSVPFIAREVAEDYELNGKLIPKGTTIILFIYGMHRNPRIFPNPEKFDPDRFLNDSRLNKHPYEYIPFSAGQRNCIGQKFAIFELKSVLSKVVRNYELCSAGPENGVRPYVALTLKSANGVKIRIQPRKYL